MEIGNNPQTILNVERMLALTGLSGFIIQPYPYINEPDRSRVYAIAPAAELDKCRANRAEWSACSGANHQKHNLRAEISYRSRTTPSLQFIVYGVYGKEQKLVECDVDEHSPFISFWLHTDEVLRNMLLRRQTDPQKIATAIDILLLKENNHASV